MRQKEEIEKQRSERDTGAREKQEVVRQSNERDSGVSHREH